MRFDTFKHRLPTREHIVNTKCLKFLEEHIRDHNLWHFTRRSLSRATAIGLFCAFLPMPFEMLPAAIGAIVFRANLPVSLAWVWVSNPLTWIPLFTPAYLLGAKLLGVNAMPLEQITFGFLGSQLAALWLGCLIVGGALATLGFWTVRVLWRIKVLSVWKDRRRRHRIKAALKKATSHVVSAAHKHRIRTNRRPAVASRPSDAAPAASSPPTRSHE